MAQYWPGVIINEPGHKIESKVRIQVFFADNMAELSVNKKSKTNKKHTTVVFQITFLPQNIWGIKKQYVFPLQMFFGGWKEWGAEQENQAQKCSMSWPTMT